jgi:hypothetical protein
MIAASASFLFWDVSVILGISVSYTPVCAKRYKTLRFLLGISHSAKPSSIKAASHFAMILSKS